MEDYNKLELEKLSYFDKDINDVYCNQNAGSLLNLLVSRLHEYLLKVEVFQEKEKTILLITQEETERKPSFADYTESEYIVAWLLSNHSTGITCKQLKALFLDLLYRGYALH